MNKNYHFANQAAENDAPVELSPGKVYREFADASLQYLLWIIIGVLILFGTSLYAASDWIRSDSSMHHLLRDIGIAILVAAIIAIVYETYARTRFELMLMNSFLGAVIADWSRQDIWDVLKAQIIEKSVIRENFRIGIRLTPDKRLAPGQMLLKMNVEYDLLGLRSKAIDINVEHFLDWHFKIKGHDLPRFCCVRIADNEIPLDSEHISKRGEFSCPVRVPAKGKGALPVASIREEVVYCPGTNCFVLNEITKGLEICLEEIPEDFLLFVTVRPHGNLKYRELKVNSAEHRVKINNMVLFPGQVVELLFQPREHVASEQTG
ncbi:MAG: hypothetical protein ACXWJE_07775 [Burkholderiaceae bacterium]